MYVPNFESILRAINVDRNHFEYEDRVQIPTKLLKFLLQIAVESGDFNEAGYLRDNADISEAIGAGDVQDPRMHYTNFGYFEGRRGGTPDVDEKWYLRTYGDVDQAVKLGKIESATEHYNVIGGAEGRSPNASVINVADRWKKVLTP